MKRRHTSITLQVLTSHKTAVFITNRNHHCEYRLHKHCHKIRHYRHHHKFWYALNRVLITLIFRFYSFSACEFRNNTFKYAIYLSTRNKESPHSHYCPIYSADYIKYLTLCMIFSSLNRMSWWSTRTAGFVE